MLLEYICSERTRQGTMPENPITVKTIVTTDIVKKIAEKYTVLERVYDSVTNFIFIKTPAAKEIHSKLLEKSIAIRCMGAYIRISAGTKEENAAVIAALEDILPQVKN